MDRHPPGLLQLAVLFEALARACSDWRRVARMDAPGAWVHRVAMNLASSHYRRRAAERRAVVRHGSRQVEDPGSDHAGALAVRRAVAALPLRQRTALVLRYHSDLSVEQTAEAMGCAAGSVKLLTSQALAALRAADLIDPVDPPPSSSAPVRDVRDLLHSAAGEPLAPLDLPAVLRDGARRTSRRRALLTSAAVVPAAVAAVVLFGLPGSSGTERLVPATPGAPAPSAPARSPGPRGSAQPAPAAPVAPSSPARTGTAGPGAAPRGTVPPPVPSSAPTGTDGAVYVLLTGLDPSGYGFTYDRIDYRGDASVAALPKPTRTGQVVAQCYTNVNPLRRHAAADPSTSVVIADSSGEPLPSDWAGLRTEVARAGASLSARPWLVTLHAGTVTSIVGQVYEVE